VTSAVFERTGLRTEIELAPRGAGELAVLLELRGITDGDLPRVTPSRAGQWREHRCPKQQGRAFSAANFNRKRR
jgi:hypothetical protein